MNLSENMIEGILAGLTSIVYSFCARLYGQRRAKRKAEKIITELQARQKPTSKPLRTRQKRHRSRSNPRTVRHYTSPLNGPRRHGKAEA